MSLERPRTRAARERVDGALAACVRAARCAPSAWPAASSRASGSGRLHHGWRHDRSHGAADRPPARRPITELDVRNVTPPPRFEVKAPAGAPNVVIVLIDDLGFGVTSAFGGPVPMPTLDRLAQSGLRYNNFHTTALCSPTRAALKSGRNHHTVNMGFITEMATGCRAPPARFRARRRRWPRRCG